MPMSLKSKRIATKNNLSPRRWTVGANICRLILWVYGVFRPHNQPRYLLLITDKMRLLRSTCCQGYFTPGGRRNMSASLSSAQTEEV